MITIKNITTLVVAGAMVLMSACDPIEDRDILENTYVPDDIQVEAVQSSGGTGNGLTLKMNTPGVYGYWDYKLGKAHTNEVSFVSPFMGDVTFTYYVATPYISGEDPAAREYVTKTVSVNVQVADNEVAAPFYALVGENLEGKTWVFNGTAGSGKVFWAMCSPTNPNEIWWNAGDDPNNTPADANGKMVFDLNGAANYTYYAEANGTPIAGSFNFSPDYKKLTVSGAGFLGSIPGSGGGNNGTLDIIELTADRLVLHNPAAEWDPAGQGWTWVFVPAE